ncbi:MAG: hypothetical protein ACOCV2_04790 [Persicimonas sp.]
MERMSSTAIRAAIVAFALLVGCASTAAADESDRPTVQERFASKAERAHLHLSTSAPVRDDFYRSLGFGLDFGYHFNETIGAELRWIWLRNWEVAAAEQIREDTGYVPDARPQQMFLLTNGRLSVGYGKVLLRDSFVVHFDPQLVAGGGVAVAEGHRVLPTVTTGISVLTHFNHSIQAKLDLQMAVQAEDRNRGWVVSTTFLPTVGVGLRFDLPGGPQ